MPKFIVFALGVVAGVAISALYLPALMAAKGHASFVEGHTKGIAVGRFEAAEVIEREFGHANGESPYQVLLSTTGRVYTFSGTIVKTSSIVCIATNGVKTVGVIP